MSRVRVVRVEGDPYARGLAVGRELSDLMHRSLAWNRSWLARRGIEPDALPGLLGDYRDAAQGAYPELMREIDGMADGAGAPWWELFAVNSFEEIELRVLADASVVPVERCTSFAVATPEGTILGHNEMWYAGETGNVAVVVARPEEGPPFASATVVCCLPVVGMNGWGYAQGVMSVSAEDERVGIPRVPVSRAVLQASGLDDAVERSTPEGRSGGYAYAATMPGGAASIWETTATSHSVLSGRSAHTNHYLDPGLARLSEPPSEGSVARLARIDELLASRPPTGVEDAMALLADHEGGPPSICLHPDPSAGDEGDAVVFSMVCDMEAARMWVSPGNPCIAPFEEIDLEEAFS